MHIDRCVWWLVLFPLANGNNLSHHFQEMQTCQPGRLSCMRLSLNKIKMNLNLIHIMRSKSDFSACYNSKRVKSFHKFCFIAMISIPIGFYCPVGSFSPIPCPKGTYGPSSGAVSIDSCLKCPPQHYCPRQGLSACLPCGPEAQQPLTGQDTCVCLGLGQSFQVTTYNQ